MHEAALSFYHPAPSTAPRCTLKTPLPVYDLWDRFLLEEQRNREDKGLLVLLTRRQSAFQPAFNRVPIRKAKKKIGKTSGEKCLGSSHCQ